MRLGLPSQNKPNFKLHFTFIQFTFIKLTTFLDNFIELDVYFLFLNLSKIDMLLAHVKSLM